MMNGGYDWRAAAADTEEKRVAKIMLDKRMCSDKKYGGEFGGYTYLESVGRCVPKGGTMNTGLNVQDLVAIGAPDNSEGIEVMPEPALTNPTGNNSNDNGEAAITNEMNARQAVETQRKPSKQIRRMAGEKMRPA